MRREKKWKFGTSASKLIPGAAAQGRSPGRLALSGVSGMCRAVDKGGSDEEEGAAYLSLTVRTHSHAQDSGPVLNDTVVHAGECILCFTQLSTYFHS